MYKNKDTMQQHHTTCTTVSRQHTACYSTSAHKHEPQRTNQQSLPRNELGAKEPTNQPTSQTWQPTNQPNQQPTNRKMNNQQTNNPVIAAQKGEGGGIP